MKNGLKLAGRLKQKQRTEAAGAAAGQTEAATGDVLVTLKIGAATATEWREPRASDSET